MGCIIDDQKKKKRFGLKIAGKNNPSKSKTIQIKIVLLGDTGVGKSSLATRFNQDKFLSLHEVTIGGAYFQQEIILPTGTFVKVHIWDTGGAERFRSMTHIYYKDSVGAIFVYDATLPKTFDMVKYWLDDLETHTDSKLMILGLAANKCDVMPNNPELLKKGREYAQENNMIFMETSAKTGAGVKDLFETVIRKCEEIA